MQEFYVGLVLVNSLILQEKTFLCPTFAVNFKYSIIKLNSQQWLVAARVKACFLKAGLIGSNPGRGKEFYIESFPLNG